MSAGDNLLTALSLFTMDAPEWSIEEAAARLNVSGSTAYRYFSSLAKAGFLEQSRAGRYVLGPAVIALDRQLRLQDRLIRAAEPVMRRLIRRNDDEGVVLLCRRFRQQVMCIHEVFDHRPPNAVSYERGRPMGLYRGAASLIILAYLPSKVLRKLWLIDSAIMVETLGSSWDEVRATLKNIRREGVCVTYAHLDPGVVGISAPILDEDRRAVHSISLVVAEHAASPTELAGLKALVQAAAQEINGAREVESGAGEDEDAGR